MRKRLLSTLLVLCMVLGMLPGTARAAEVASGECGDNVTWELNNEGTLTIEGEGPMTNYAGASYRAPWYPNRTQIKSIIVKDGVTSVGDYAFGHCNNLTGVTLSSSITYIGTSAFYESNITNIIIPDSVTTIGDWAFGHCADLMSISIPNNVVQIGERVFLGCSNLSVINVSPYNSHYCSIDGVLYSTDHSTLVVYPGGKTDSEYSILDGTHTIMADGFYGCNYLVTINVPSSINSIPENFVQNTYNLSYINVSPNNTQYCSIDGVLYSKDCKKLVIYPSGKSENTYDILDSVTNLGDYAFWGCKSLTSIIIPSNVTTITGMTFGNCANLSSVTIPENVSYLSNAAFYYSGNIKDVYYQGSEDQWNQIYKQIISIDYLKSATIHYADTPTPPTHPTPGNSSIVWLYPSNGTEDVDYDKPIFGVMFDRAIATIYAEEIVADVDLTTDGGFAIYRAADDKLVYQSTKDSTYSFLRDIAYPEKTVLKIAPYSSIGALEPNTQYYITMDEGFVRFADGTGSPEIKKGEWFFKTSLSEILVIRNGTFNYTSSEDMVKTYHYSYDESWFFENSYNYQHDLAKMSICAAMSAYGTPDDSLGAGNIETLMKDLKFDHIETSYPDIAHTMYDSIGYAIGSKSMVSDSGKKTTLVFVAIRGGGYGIEWGGDFRVGLGKTHEGFALARDQVIEGIEQYFSDYGEFFLPECKIWIVGYSRGAATANLVAKELDDGALNGVNVNPENVFAFCFECPRNTREKDTSDEKYKNIINIANPIDFVTKVAMSSPSRTWGYNRYGTTLYLPYDLGGKNFYQLRNQMNSEYNRITGENMPYAFGQSLILDDFFSDLATMIGTPQLYVLKNQHAFMAFAANSLGGEAHLDITWKDITAVPALGQMLQYHLISTLQVGELYLLGTFKSAHFSELCLAWMNSLDGKIGTFMSPIYRKIFINCPVNVSVYDSENHLVAQITDDVISEIEEGVFSYIDDNGQKIFALPIDEEYSIEMTATDEGTVTYTATEYNIDTGTTEKLIGYYEIDVAENDTLVGLVENLETVSSAQYPLYLNGSDEPLSPSVDQNGVTVQELTVEVSKSGNGAITGGGIYVSGEFAKVTATANSGETFLGWYMDNILVSLDLEYRFLVNKSVGIVAKFTENVSPDTPDMPTPSYPSGNGINGSNSSNHATTPTAHSITITSVVNGKVTATPTSSAKGSTITLTVTPDEGYELTALMVTDSKGNELELTDKGSGNYTFTMPDSAVTVDAEFKPIAEPPADSSSIWTNPFTDVAADAWYYEAVKFVSANSLMNGSGNNLFEPSANLSRAMLAQILYNKEGQPNVTNNSIFTDVSPEAWYANAVNWAAMNGIVGGYGNGLFGPNDNITREQLAAMLWRYAGEPASSAAVTFSDADQISGFAQDAIRWAVANGILNGKGNNILDPKGFATRAEVAQMLKNYLDT